MDKNDALHSKFPKLTVCNVHKYFKLTNNRAGWNKRAGWQISQN